MGEQGVGAGGGELTEGQKKFLMKACFVALVATSFAFVMRAFLVAEWQVDFGLSETQKGEIMGAGLWPFGLSIVLFSLFIDRVGYGKSMIFAFVCHLVSTVLFVFAWGYWPLWIGSVLGGLAAGTVEAVINPAIASVYPKEKTKQLTILHAGWPGGLALCGMVLLLLGEQGLGLPWRYRVFVILIPVIAYGIMLLKTKFAPSERVSAGVSYKGMLAEAGALSCLIVAYLVLININGILMGWTGINSKYTIGILYDGTFFDVPSVLFTLLIVAATVFYFIYTQSLGRWMYVFLLFVMILLAITELGTDAWIKELMGPAMAKVGMSGGWVLVYTSLIMTILRFLIGPIQRLLASITKVLATPPAFLLLSSLFAAVGLFFLPRASGGWIILFATIYGTGQCFFWPVTLGLVSERFPKGGALTLNAVAGVGMLGVGILGTQLLGFWQDTSAHRNLMANEDKTAYTRLMETEDKTSIFGEYRALNAKKVKDINYKTAIFDYRKEAKDPAELAKNKKYQTQVRGAYNQLVREKGDIKIYSHEEMESAIKAKGMFIEAADYELLAKDRDLVGGIKGTATKDAMARVAVLPLIMAACYLFLIFYFKKKLGGYKAIEIGAEG